MRYLNLLSVIGLIISFYLSYIKYTYGVKGPTGYPFIVTNFILAAFVLSYLFSLFEVKSSVLKLFALVVVFISTVVTGVYVVMVMLGSAYYPKMFSIPACHLEFILFAVLTYLWNKKR